MPIPAKAEMNHIQYWRCSCKLAQFKFVAPGIFLEVFTGNRHRIQVFSWQRNTVGKMLLDMSKIAFRIAIRRVTLVNLKDLHPLPGKIMFGKLAQHRPWRTTPAERDRELAALADRFLRSGIDEFRAGSCDIVRRVALANLHQDFSTWPPNA